MGRASPMQASSFHRRESLLAGCIVGQIWPTPIPLLQANRVLRALRVPPGGMPQAPRRGHRRLPMPPVYLIKGTKLAQHMHDDQS